MVIIPAHNVEKYVEDCINSVISQKTKYSFAIFIVENGSTDNTKEILRQYEDKDNVFCISMEKGDLASARNYVLSNIVGKYVMFVDSDDMLQQGAIEALLDKAYSFDADIVEGNVERINNKGEVLKCSNFAESMTPEDCVKNLRGQTWAKVMKAELWNNLIFPENYYYEDSVLSYCIYPFIEKKYRVSEVVYKYRYNTDGITVRSKSNYRSIESYWLSMFLWHYLLSRKTIDNDIFNQLLVQVALNQSRVENLDIEVQKSIFSEMVRYFEELGYNSKKCLDKKKKLLLKSLSERKFKMYCVICKYWAFL